jgi:phosphatidylglycerol---prolipoprotein diacylglyceryl transferase
MFAYYVHNLSPFLVRFNEHIGIRYYGLAYALGFLGLYFGLRWQVKRGWLALTKDDVVDFLTAMIVGVIVGGRLTYCLLYGWETTVHDPLSIFYVWQGGMASHGGIAGAVVAIFWFARKKGIPFYVLADATALCTPPPLALGRIANFINGELWGRPATVAWAVIFPDAPLVNGVAAPRHPSQLYESALEGVLLTAVLLVLRFKAKRAGTISIAFLAGYAMLRIVGEFFREPDAQIGYYFGFVTQGQLLSLALLAVTGVMAWRLPKDKY